jgi:hypothetical protein
MGVDSGSGGIERPVTVLTKYPTETSAWAGDWEERLYGRVRERGFSSVTEFVESRPSATLGDLADELGVTDIAPVQIEWRWVAESEQNDTMERCARGLLARQLRWKLPEGWHREWRDVPGDPKTPLFRKIGAFSSLVVALPEKYKDAVQRVRRAFDAAEIPVGWLPTDADDPVIVELFRRHWPVLP